MGKKISRVMSYGLIATLIFLCFVTLKVMSIPSDIQVSQQNSQKSILANYNIKSNILYKVNSTPDQDANKSNEEINLCVKLFGIIPVKNVTLNIMPEVKVLPGGESIGVKLKTDGPLVVGFSDIETNSGCVSSPAQKAGIEVGDSIKSINDNPINSNADIINVVNENKGQELTVKLLRKDKMKEFKISPICAKEKNSYKIGIWVRDSTAGIGTVTFYEPTSDKFAALGHPINDIDTGSILSIREGEIYNAKIISVQPGTKGKPGELRGVFSENDRIGSIYKNTQCGIYGSTKNLYRGNNQSNLMEIARKDEVKEGPAIIRTAIDSSGVKEYSINIEKVSHQNRPNSKSMIIKITDKQLLKKTGGIVQGMSGSPIIQDGKLVGAVTHVFVNKPDMGYGIYSEWMINDLGINL